VEIGHLTDAPPGARACPWGSRGCRETMVSMNSLVQSARDGYPDNRDSLLFKRMTPGEVSHRDIYDAANAGDRFARAVVDDHARWLGIGIANT
ncbi:MAG: ROK family protein, partial [Planctomycetes bacterium]|nr:ROK family protein [Planctomycetota bacterium]